MIAEAELTQQLSNALERINSIWSDGAMAWAENKAPDLVTDLDGAEAEVNAVWTAALAGKASVKDFREAVGSYTAAAWRMAKRHRERDR